MNHTHYALFKEYESDLVCVLPKDFKIETLTRAIQDEEGDTVEDLSYDEGMLGRDFHPLYVTTLIDEETESKYYLQPTWLYEND